MITDHENALAMLSLRKDNAALKCECERLKAELEGCAWDTSPAMAQARIDQLNAEVDRLRKTASYDAESRRDAAEIRRAAAHMGFELPDCMDADRHPIAQCMSSAMFEIVQLRRELAEARDAAKEEKL
jgi:hypothetical protein